MEMEKAFKMAQENTRFIKERKNLLYTFGATRLPYICLSVSSEDSNYVMVRSGEVMADKPQIAVPGEIFSFEGFSESDELSGDDLVISLARRISMPPSKYVNKADSAVRETCALDDAVQRVLNRLDNDNDVRTGVISAPDQVWALSVLLYVGSQVARSAPSNVQEHFEHLRLRR